MMVERRAGWMMLAVGGLVLGCGSDVQTGSGGAGGSGGTSSVGAGGTGGQGGQGGTTGCPAELPIEGSNCDGPSPCSYGVTEPCGLEQTVTATCVPIDDEISLWELDVPDCNGDPADCGDYDHPSLCVADTSCRWLVQGCGDPGEPMLEAGCYPNFDCTPGDCGGGQTCTAVTYDPCHTFCTGCAVCGACGSQADLCL